MGPPFYFTIEPMAPHMDAPLRRGRNGRWLPPQALGNNLKQAPWHFHHDGTDTNPVGQIPGADQLFKTFSLYHDQAVIWMVPFDATSDIVGDGLESTATRGEPRENGRDNDDWATLTFKKVDRNMFFAGIRQPHRCLPAERVDQTWAEHLLPDTYRAMEIVSEDQPYASLVGELPLLLGLAALTIPATLVDQYIPRVVRNPWQILAIPRRAGWQNQRGVVVTVYTDPGPWGQQSSTREDLEAFESGKDGPILP